MRKSLFYWQESQLAIIFVLAVCLSQLDRAISRGIRWNSKCASFAPKGRLIDFLAIFQHGDSFLNISEQEFRDFSTGLRMVFRYMNNQNLYSFNLSIDSGIARNNFFWTQARIVPRMTFLESQISDQSYYEVLQEVRLCFEYPEDTCRELKKYFND